jgi:hypothetical protein
MSYQEAYNIESMVIYALLIIVFLKGVLIGGEFNILHYLRYKQIYWKWYNSRETFDEYLK